jgi:PiT family inorganic phosphate transporter
LQIAAAAFLSYSHGRNDGQNAMGIIALAWAVYYVQPLEIEFWMIAVSALTIGAGTTFGGWRVIRTLGMRVTRLEPINGFAANVVAASVIEAATQIGLPVSTTHTSTSSIMGVGATRRMSAVRWGVTRSIGLAWIVTYPVCLVLGWTMSKLLLLVT